MTIEEANADVARMVPLSLEEFPLPGGLTREMLESAQFGPNVHPLKEDVVGDVGKVLWVLLGTVGLVLLIACANVANLFLVRAEAQQREIAMRTALGATRGRIAAQSLTESMFLGLLGGLAGLGLAYWAFDCCLTSHPPTCRASTRSLSIRACSSLPWAYRSSRDSSSVSSPSFTSAVPTSYRHSKKEEEARATDGRDTVSGICSPYHKWHLPRFF